VKGTTAIRMKRGMQWTRLQIRVLTGPRLFFFTPAELYSELNNTAVTKWPNSLNRKKCVGISQPECRRHSCMTIDLVVQFMFSSQGLGYSRVLQTRVFPVL
jgi:hypothetical protein